MWVGRAPRSAPACASVAVVDGGGLASTSRGGAAQRKSLAFLLLTASRLALNAHRQPSADLVAALAAAAEAAAPWRTTTAPLELPPPPPTRSAAPPGSRLPALPPVDDPAATVEVVDAEEDEAAEVEAGRPELVSVLRDAQLQLRAGGVALSEPQLFAHWLRGAAAGARRALGEGFRRRALHSVVPPSDLDLELLADGKPLPAASPFAAALAALADALVAGLRPAAPPGAAPTGDAIAEWMVRVADGLNA